MFRLLFGLVMLLGIATCSQYKQDLIETLNRVETRLKTVKADTLQKGFNLYKPTFDQFLSKVGKLQSHAQQLKDDSSAQDDIEFYNLAVDLIDRIDRFIEKPFPIEHLKADALYLVAKFQYMYDNTAGYLLTQNVTSIIEQEANTTSKWPEWDENPTPEVAKLREMYENLEDYMKHQNYPTFENHYLLMSKAQKYVEGKKSEEAERIRKDIKVLENQTFLLATDLPITSKIKAEIFLTQSGHHYRQMKVVRDDIHEQLSTKEAVLEKLIRFEKQVLLPMERFRKDGFVHYANVVKNLHQQILDTIVEVKNFDVAKETIYYRFFDLERKVDELEIKVLGASLNPDPITAIKAKALYLAASGIVPKPEVVYGLVENFVEFQAYYALLSPQGPGTWLSGRVLREVDTQNFNAKLHIIQSTIEGFEPPAQKDFDTVILSVRESGQHVDELNHFVNETLEMNGLLPLSDKKAVEKYFKIAGQQYKDYQNLQKSSSIVDNLLDRLDIASRKLFSGIAKFQKRSANYYAKILEDIQHRLREVQKGFKSRGRNLDEEEAKRLTIEVSDLEAEVASRVENPSPRTAIKVDALYLAGIRVNKDSAGFMVLLQTVTEIVRSEKQIRSLSKPTIESIVLDQKYTTLANLMKGSKIPTAEDFEKLVEQAKKKIQELKTKNPPEGHMLETEVSKYEQLAVEMNNLLPVDQENDVEKLYSVSQRHFYVGDNVEKLIARNS